MFSLGLDSSLSLEGGISVDTFFHFAMRQVGVKSSSLSVRLVKRHGASEAFWTAMLATLLLRNLSSHPPSPILHQHEHDLDISSSCTPCTCHPSYTCLSSTLSCLHSSCWGNRLCSGQLHHTHSIASSCFFSCTCHQGSSCTCRTS